MSFSGKSNKIDLLEMEVEYASTKQSCTSFFEFILKFWDIEAFKFCHYSFILEFQLIKTLQSSI